MIVVQPLQDAPDNLELGLLGVFLIRQLHLGARHAALVRDVLQQGHQLDEADVAVDEHLARDCIRQQRDKLLVLFLLQKVPDRCEVRLAILGVQQAQPELDSRQLRELLIRPALDEDVVLFPEPQRRREERRARRDEPQRRRLVEVFGPQRQREAAQDEEPRDRPRHDLSHRKPSVGAAASGTSDWSG